MEFSHFEVTENDSDRRIDKVVSRLFESRGIDSGVFPLFRKGLIKLNDKKTKPEQRTKTGDIISIASFLIEKTKNMQKSCKTETSLNLEEITVFRNQHLWILNKPAGLNVQPAKDCPICLADIVSAQTENNSINSLSFRPGPLHRIDRGTSGLIVFSQSLKGAKWFTENMENHSISKTYHGITEGSYISTEEKYEDLIFTPETRGNTFGTVEVGNPNGKKAITTAKFLSKLSIDGKEANLMEFSIETGRKHQIRAQSAYHGHPLTGDTAYGGRKIKNNMFYLHAFKLTFPENQLDIPLEVSVLEQWENL